MALRTPRETRFDGAEMRRAREAAGQTREQLSVAIDLSYQSIVNYERANVFPSVSTARRIEEVLGLPPGHLNKVPRRKRSRVSA